MAKAFTDEDDALLEELGVEVEAKRQGSRTPREERIIAGFEEIQRFVAEHARLWPILARQKGHGGNGLGEVAKVHFTLGVVGADGDH